MHDENAYDALTTAEADARWAYGTGFDDPLAGVDTTVPPDVDGAALAADCLALGDDALVYSHRLQQWITRLPDLEEEAAVANIALDLLGQARLLLARVGTADGTGRTEDELAFLREQHEFRNVRLAELDNGDFAELVVRLLVLATWRLDLMERRLDHPDPVLAAIAGKAVKELAYHRDYAADWTVRLGGGTDESRRRTESALRAVWPYVAELEPNERVGADLDGVLADAGLARPEVEPAARVGGRAGRDGVHTEALSYLLAEMQSVARAHPDAQW
jgi:ring-1,2-phenylacetyl-CoA epoxidase subunit PaaC